MTVLQRRPGRPHQPYADTIPLMPAVPAIELPDNWAACAERNIAAQHDQNVNSSEQCEARAAAWRHAAAHMSAGGRSWS